jgi:hypothetical protein
VSAAAAEFRGSHSVSPYYGTQNTQNKPKGSTTKGLTMTMYLLSIYQPDGDPPPPDVLARVMADIDVINRELRATGSWVFAGGLHPPTTATVVRVRDGDVLMTDGPFVEGKEHIGGFTIIKAPDLDAALEWGRRLATATTLPIEVRPFQGERE